MKINIRLPSRLMQYIKAVERDRNWVTQEYVNMFAPSNISDQDLFTIKVVLALMGLLHDEYKLSLIHI